MNFEDYRYDTELRALNIQTQEERKQWRNDFAYTVFKKLKETNKYRLMMIGNCPLVRNCVLSKAI